jgi:iron complex outermembrane receptor protein
MRFYYLLSGGVGLLAAAFPAAPQAGGTVRGAVTMQPRGTPVHDATVRIPQLGRGATTGVDGRYEIRNVPPGAYTVLAHMHDFTDESKRIRIEAGAEVELNFTLQLATVRTQVTVTATGQEQTALEAFQTVVALDSFQITERAEPSLGEMLENEPGVAKRSFGPGTARPVIRGFDGDRVLIMQDGAPSGALSSQSGDHGESMDPLQLESIEIVKGPATLLYGSNAIGGVVNAITGHHQVHEHPHSGLHAALSAVGASNNGHAGASGGLEYGRGRWLLWGDTGGQRTGDYHTPLGPVDNSHTRVTNHSGGAGWYGDKPFLTLGYGYDGGRYGVPFAGAFEGGEDERIDLAFRRHHLRLNTGYREMGGIVDAFRLSLNYSGWQHRELGGEEVGTRFSNKQISYRGVFEQRRAARHSGSFGFSGSHRDYRAAGAEALTPPVKHNNLAAFALQEFGFERFRLQLGARMENNRYAPEGLRRRSFTGFSGGAGVNVPFWTSGAFVVHYSYSYRAPALEELYNQGPHIGNLTFEIGNPNLVRERSKGIELAVRRQSRRLRAEFSGFRYDIQDFVYLAPAGDIEDGLIVAEHSQAGSRFTGVEASIEAAIVPDLWLRFGMDYVDAQLKDAGTPLPRIPPLRGRAGVDFRRGPFSLRPELIMAARQHQVFPAETPTSGYAVVNVGGSYTLAQQHAVHVFGAQLFNAGDRLYRNHLSFIKEQAPEIGRGVKFTYTMRFF